MQFQNYQRITIHYILEKFNLKLYNSFYSIMSQNIGQINL